jgi:hypothetical protein
MLSSQRRAACDSSRVTKTSVLFRLQQRAGVCRHRLRAGAATSHWALLASGVELLQAATLGPREGRPVDTGPPVLAFTSAVRHLVHAVHLRMPVIWMCEPVPWAGGGLWHGIKL